jgi:hypothetical protein
MKNFMAMIFGTFLLLGSQAVYAGIVPLCGEGEVLVKREVVLVINGVEIFAIQYECVKDEPTMQVSED